MAHYTNRGRGILRTVSRRYNRRSKVRPEVRVARKLCRMRAGKCFSNMNEASR